MWTLVLALIAFGQCWCSPAAVHTHAHVHKRPPSQSPSREYEHHGHYKEGEHLTEFDHEAILGSVKDADEFDHLPVDESKRRLGVLLLRMDADADGYISKDELKHWIMRSFIKLSEEEAAERFQEIDADQDNRLTWKEYISETFGLESEYTLPSEDSSADETMMREDKIMFNAADENKDGLLNFEEFVLFSNPEEHPKMHEHVLAQTLREKDSNGDGKIDFQEFIGEKGLEHDKEWIVEEKDKFDSDYDSNGDGILEGKEIANWVIPDNEEIAEDEVEHLFASSDDDHDLMLSFAEIIDHHDLFVGSEATDYGDQLLGSHFDDEL